MGNPKVLPMLPMKSHEEMQNNKWEKGLLVTNKRRGRIRQVSTIAPDKVAERQENTTKVTFKASRSNIIRSISHPIHPNFKSVSEGDLMVWFLLLVVVQEII